MISVLCLSYELLAEATTRPRTRAAIVAISPITSFTRSFDSVLTWCSGRAARSTIPSNAPPKTHARTIEVIAMDLTHPLLAAARRCRCRHVRHGDGRHPPEDPLVCSWRCACGLHLICLLRRRTAFGGRV